MKKSMIICVAIILAVILVVGGYFLITSKKEVTVNQQENVAQNKIETVEDMKDLVEKMYDKSGVEMFGIETNEVDVNDDMLLPGYTGLTSSEGLDKLVVSECMITSRAYSLVLVKVADSANVEEVKQKMVDNINMRKWICVQADVLYATNSGNVICMVMSDEETAKPMYDAFKEVAGGKLGKELEKMPEEIEF